jgi:hypothetical protein
MKTTMEIKRTEGGWEMSCPVVNRDYHIRFEVEPRDIMRNPERWVLDEFDTSVSDNNEAHIESSNHDTAEQAMQEAFDRCEDILNQKKRHD